MDANTEPQEPPVLEGQTSINDYLEPSIAIIPVQIKEPTDAELTAWLSSEGS